MVLSNGVTTLTNLVNTTVTMNGRCELRLLSAANPISGCVIELNSPDAFLVLQNVKPSLASGYLPQLRVNGASAIENSNCRLAQYGGSGTIVIPHGPAFQPLQLFDGPHFTGASISLRPHSYYTGPELRELNGASSSLKLKRGYMATLAQNEDGSGPSRNFVAQEADVEVSLLPSSLENRVRFVFVAPWRWTSKKGIAGNIERPLNVQWKYNWNISENSTRDLEYVPIRQSRFWPDLASQNWQTRGATHLLGYNEPDRPDQSNLSVADALSSWPDLLATGLRLGAPAVSDGGRNGWLYPFMTQADAAELRVDFVPVHYYWCFNPADPAGAANQMYNFLKATYDNVKRPLWVTEWNNGANWTGCGDPTFAQQRAAIAAMIEMLEETPFVERYALYNWVEDVRRLHWDNATLTEAGVVYRDRISTLAYQQAFPDIGTRGFAQLRFDADTLDTSGHGNNGVVSGSPAYTSGRKNQALVLDGTNTVVTLPPNIARRSAFTFAAWIYWRGGGHWQRIFDFGNSTTEYLFLTPRSSSGTLRFAIKDGGAEQMVETGALPVNQWRHVAVTLSGGTARLYVNGTLTASNARMTIVPANFNPRVNFLGKSQFGADPLFQGLMDDVVIADAALSATQIAALQSDAAPEFTSGFIELAEAAQGQPYTNELAGAVTDANGDNIVFSKVNGPAWFTISPNGSIAGTPTGGDSGTNYFTVRASDPAGASAFAVLAIPVNSSLTDQPMLLARYAFEGNANDSSGNAFHGMVQGSGPYVGGRFGTALDFDGANRYVTLPPRLLSQATNFTIAAWVNWDGGGAWQRIFDFGNGTSQYLFLTPNSGSGTLRFAIKNGGAEQTVQTSALPVNQWRHVAITRSGTVARLYVNGILVASNSGLTITPASINPRMNFLGKSQFAADPLFNGRVDEFFIYNYALTSAEIDRLMNNQPPPRIGVKLMASIVSGRLMLSWPIDAVGNRLEINRTDLADSGAWSTVPESAGTNQISLPLDSLSAPAFFRLGYP
jgi:hypothetical protein